MTFNSTAEIAGDTSQDSDRGSIVYIILLLCRFTSSALSVFCNSLICYVICSKRSVRTNTNYFILSISFSDFIFAIASFWSSVRSLLWALGFSRESKTECLIFGGILVLSQRVSICSVLCITLEMYIKVIYPLRYTSIVRDPRLWAAVSGVWIYSFSVSSIVIVGFDRNLIVSDVFPCVCSLVSATEGIPASLSHVPPLCVVISLYVKVLHVSWKHMRSIQTIEGHLPATGNDVTISNTKLMKLVGTLIVSLVLVYVPLAIALFLSQRLSADYSELKRCAYSFSLLVFVTNGILNTTIYHIRREGISREVSKIFSKVTRLMTCVW